MSTAQQPYYACIKRTLHAAICIGNFPSQVVERHNKPEVEARQSTELLGNPITIARSAQEVTLIETSVNSVRVSICFQKSDGLAELIARKYVGFLAQRAEKFHILRKKPVDGFDISFLITHDESETMQKNKVIDFIIQFISDIDQDISSMKLGTNKRGREAALEFFSKLNF
eukprot:Tbor_TRINITY_DN1994_c0_g1::TRINITY_DN1994_c0_g1_i1::g.3515::m.3515/K05755/ARPC4; actin related protein 2/3 complex, subunit 4